MGSGEDVDDVLNHTLSSFDHLLKNKLFKVPTTCLTLGRVLAKPNRYSKPTKKRSMIPCLCLSLGNPVPMNDPILPTAEFFDLCRREVASLKRFNHNDTEGRKSLTAVADYLHDAGNIIQLVKSDVVVVDPNWFTFSFLGRLIGAGHNFQNPLVRVDHYKHQKDGHLSTAAFKDLLQRFSQILRDEGYNGADDELLEKLMAEMDLSFYVPQAFGYFAPAIFAEEELKKSSEGLRQLQAWRCVADRPNKGREIIFVGARLQCRDQLRTSLTPSFFPRFQVHFRNLLISSRGLRQDQIDCDYNVICFIFEEYEIYVESDGHAGDRIDNMVRSPTTRTKTFECIHENVVPAIQDFCASCCPGVALVAGVMRTECVENLTLSAHRNENQAILVEDLKDRWKEYILSRDVHSTMLEKEEDFANYSYLWPSNKDANLKQRLERAKDLLTNKDYLEVLKLAKGAIESLGKELDTLQSISEEIDKTIGARSSEGGSSGKQTADRTATSHHSERLPTTQARSLQRQLTDTMIGHDRTHYEIQKLRHEVRELHEDVNEVRITIKDIQRNVKNVQRYQHEILATRVGINGKLDQLIGVTASLAKSVVPNRPYFTSADVKWTHRVSATVYFGKAMTLHFMCEERTGNHLVKEQPGYPITVSKENVDFLRFLSVNSVKVLWYLLKAGVHVAAGLGNVIPDLEIGGEIALLTANTIGSMLMSQESSNVIQSKVVDSDQTNVDRGDSWQFLKQLFSEALRGRCVEYFLLYRARYVTAPIESGQVWLCKECV